MRVVFAGTPEFSVPTLRRLVEAGVDVVAVYTQPDRPAGRGRKARASAVKIAAEQCGLPVMQPRSLKGEQIAAALNALGPDVMVVVAYGLILPPDVLATPAFGCVNVHASLLPRWRGAAPIARAIEAGDAVTGVTIMKMDSGLDTGPILAARAVALGAEQGAAEVHDMLARAGAELLVETLPAYLEGDVRPRPQDENKATYAPKVSKAEGRIDWRRNAPHILNQIRAFNLWPIAYTFHGQQRIRIHKARLAEAPSGPHGPPPGTVRRADKTGVEVVCGEGALVLLRMQRDGGRPLPAGEFVNGYPIAVGESLQ